MNIEISKLNYHSWEKELFASDKGEDYQLLRDDIKERGLQTPIHITGDKAIGEVKAHTIIAGHRRVKAMKELGHKEIPAVVLSELKTENDVNAAFLYDNVLRRQLDLVQSVLVYGKLLEVESQKAKERQAAVGGKTPKPLMEKLPQAQAGAARDLAAKKLGLSGRTMEDRLKVFKWLKEDKESLQEWNTGITTTTHILEAIDAEKKYKSAMPKPSVPEPIKEDNPHKEEQAELPKSLVEGKILMPDYDEIEEQEVPQVDLIKENLERTIEILENREYTGKHKRQIQKLYELCKEALKTRS